MYLYAARLEDRRSRYVLVFRSAVVRGVDSVGVAIGIPGGFFLRPRVAVHRVLYLHSPHHRLPDEGSSSPGHRSLVHGNRTIVRDELVAVKEQNTVPGRTSIYVSLDHYVTFTCKKKDPATSLYR